MQRYRPDIAWPLTGKPWPIMAEDSEAGEYYAKAEVDEVLKRQASAALSGMDVAKAISSRQLQLARQARAESSPAALESERQANAKLTQELSLAEEGLANYAQENQRLRDCWAEALANVAARNQEIATLRNDLTATRLELQSIQRERLTWAMACECYCPACMAFDKIVIGASLPSSGHPMGDPTTK